MSMPIERVSTKVVGVAMGPTDSHGNSLRQQYLAEMKENNTLFVKLIREPENKFDSNAIAVYGDWGSGQVQIGYIQNSSRICLSCEKEFSKKLITKDVTLREKLNSGICPYCGGEISRTGLAAELSEYMDADYTYKAKVLQYTGKDDQFLGLNISIERVMSLV